MESQWLDSELLRNAVQAIAVHSHNRDTKPWQNGVDYVGW